MPAIRSLSNRIHPCELEKSTMPKNKPVPVETEDDESLDLPVAPDEGTPLIPDEERVINVPS